MLLRRVIEHIKDQNWTAVALDLVIVIVGVFLGIQVSNWNASQADRVNNKRYASYIVEDLRSDIEELKEVEAFMVRRVSAINFLLQEALQDPPRWHIPPMSPDGIARRHFTPDEYPNLLHFATFPAQVDSATSAINSLISAEGLGLLNDPDLARALQSYLTYGLELDVYEDGFIGYEQVSAHLLHAAGFSLLEPQEYSLVLESLRAHKPLAAVLRTNRNTSLLHLMLLASQLDRAEELLDALGTL